MPAKEEEVIRYRPYEGEKDLEHVVRLVETELSEPYTVRSRRLSIFSGSSVNKDRTNQAFASVYVSLSLGWLGLWGEQVYTYRYASLLYCFISYSCHLRF